MHGMCRKYKEDCALRTPNASQIVPDVILRLWASLTADLQYKHTSAVCILDHTGVGSTPQKKTSLSQ